ncbi:chemotaxis protein CheW [uncultured Maritimibacter sp.]|jgi:purine-binding chemotaxis protein CheW|uniref:chemotaxis protein CheW n=1 Tax=uncultured Maritimibacter sp. TaxID=991866 RepID=UPI00262DA59A|nr:chemotaxis protein CheW [uncultured Maritimibacter sp.]
MRHVTFRLDGEMLAIPTSVLREILEPVAVTRVPRAAALSVGLINVRGSIVPLVDLRVALRLPVTPDTADTRLLVLDTRIGDLPLSVAVIAESVHDVVDILESQVDRVPSIGSRWPPELVRGIARHVRTFITLPDLEAIFEQSDAALLPDCKAS